MVDVFPPQIEYEYNYCTMILSHVILRFGVPCLGLLTKRSRVDFVARIYVYDAYFTLKASTSCEIEDFGERRVCEVGANPAWVTRTMGV